MPSPRSIAKPALLRVAAFLCLVMATAVLLSDTVLAAYGNNLALNSLITLTFLTGLFLSLKPFFALEQDSSWLKNLVRNRVGEGKKPHYLTKIYQWHERCTTAPFTLSAVQRKEALADAEIRLHSARDVPRYIMGLLIFLGLLGTFWGLSQTIRSVADVIANLSSQGTDSLASFELLKTGLREPLAGMGTAFSCSMFGLAGSLILGFIDLQVNLAQQKFHDNLEDATATLEQRAPALQSHIQLTAGHPEYLIKVLEFMAENLEHLSATKATTAEHAEGERQVLRNIEDMLQRSLKEQTATRTHFLEEFRKEMRLLGKVLHQDRVTPEKSRAPAPSPMKAI